MAKVFYAWQSDREQKVCHYFVRDAIKVALKRIINDAKDSDVQEANRPELDHDRKDVPGTPRIAETIEKKIRKAAVFVADLTAVTDFKTFDGRDKQTPNANVLIELGMAFRSVKSERILLVMNTAFGTPQHLPFDLKDRSHPIQYDLKDSGDPEYKAKLKSLADKLVEPLKLSLKHYDEAVKLKAEGEQVAERTDQLNAIEAKRNELEAKVRDGKFRNVKGRVTVALTVAPIGPASIKIATPNDHTEQFRPMLMEIGSATGGRPDMDSVYYETTSQGTGPDNPSIVLSATEVFQNGVIFAAMDEQNERTERSRRDWVDMKVAPASSLEIPAGVYLVKIETYVIKAVQLYGKSLRSFGFTGDIAVAHTISGIEGRPMYSRDKASRQYASLNVIPSPVIVFPANEDFSDVQKTAMRLKDSFQRIWSHVGMLADPAYERGSYDGNA